MALIDQRTLGEMRSWVNLITRSRFESDEVDAELNKSYGEISSMGEFPWLRDTVSIAVAADQTIFDLPLNFRKVDILFLDDAASDDDRRKYFQENDFHLISKNLKNGQQRIEFTVSPDGDSLKLRYLLTPEKLRNNDDLPLMPNQMQRLIEVKAALSLLRIDGRDKQQIAELANETDKLTNLLLTYDKNKPSQKKRMVPVGDDGRGILEFIPLGDGFGA